MSELERLRHYYLAAAGDYVPSAPGVHPMQKLVPKRNGFRAPVYDDAKVKAIMDELDETVFKRHRAHARRLDLAHSIRRKAQHVAVEAERSILEGYHRRDFPFMPVHVRERLDEIAHLLGPPSQDVYPSAPAPA
jgi:hypothetical protein